MARNLKKEILHCEFDVTKMLRQRGTALSAAVDGYGGTTADHLDAGIYSATNGAGMIPEGSIVTNVWAVCTTAYADDSGGSAATVKFGIQGVDDDEFWVAADAGSAPTSATGDILGTGIYHSIAGSYPMLHGSETKDFGSIADGNEEEEDVTVTGAALGDFAIASLGADTTDMQLTASVTAADTVTCVFSSSGSTVDLASTTLSVLVIKNQPGIRQTVSGEVVMTSAVDEITAGKVDVYIEYIPTGLIA
jgi:hypothetical protein